jgi:hypothetical protein
MPFQPFDIVVLRPEFEAQVFAIVGIEPQRPKYPYAAVRMDKGPFTPQYHLGDQEILAKIGTLDPEALKLDMSAHSTPNPENWEVGRHFPQYMADGTLDTVERRRWALLASLKPGDPIFLRRYSARGHRVEQHRFVEVLPSGQKYNFAAINANGKVYRWTLASVEIGTELDCQKSDTGE